jgi:hypothetical protein
MNWMIVEAALNLVAIGMESSAVVAKVKALEAEGKSPEDVAKSLRQMEVDARAELRKALE